MRLVRAITTSDLQNSGYNNAVGGNTWVRLGNTPLYIYISTYGRNFVEAEGLRISTTDTWLKLYIGTAHQNWKGTEEFSMGYQLIPYRPTVALDLIPNVNTIAMRLESSAGLETLCNWNEIYPFTDGGSPSFIEFRVSYDLKTVKIVVNGRAVKTVTPTLNHDRSTLGMYYYNSPAGSGYHYIRDLYMAFFDPAVERPYLGRWSCEALSIGASDFPNVGAIDGVMDNLGIDPKNIEFTYAGTNPLKAVAVSGYGVSVMAETLEVKLKSGAVETTTVTAPTPTIPNDDSGLLVNAPNGMLFGNIDFDNVSKKVTATLKLKP